MRFSLDTTSTLDRQQGVISRRQLRSHGYTGAQIDAMLRRGHLERAEHGIYRRTGSGRASHQEEVVALLRCGPAARLTGARLLGHLGVQGFSLEDPFTVLVRPGRRFAAARFSVRNDPAADLHRATYGIARVPGTTPARTLVELAVDDACDDGALLDVYDRMRWRGVVWVGRLEPVIADLPSHPGAVRLGRLLGTAEGVVESGPERTLVAELAQLDPPLEWQVWIAPDLRVDALWRDVGLVIEYHGSATHDDDRDRASDRVRHARIRAMGYEVVVVDRHDLRNPDALRDRLLAARRARALDLEAHREVHEVRHRD